MPSFEISQPPADCTPPIRALFEHWRALHPAGGLPGRQHFDPVDVPRLLPHIWLLDVARDPLRFRFRLVGTSIVRFTGRDSTGLWCDEIYPGYAQSDAYLCSSGCAMKGTPHYRRSKLLSHPERLNVTAERLYLPLAADGKTVDVLLNMTLYYEHLASETPG